ncbi:hypothetical protein NT6N_07540 [Oceaniferula spumae]|uniref:Serine protease n=1 Tax=Oceaniferula spumae TaxID=2979115 RepID=A0AAT9FIA2_9BACT
MKTHLTLIYLALVAGCAGLVSCSSSGTSASSPAADISSGIGSSAIYKEYNAAGNSVLNKGWPYKLDASGIALDDKHTCTLITRRHVVMAKHYKRGVGKQVVFHNRQGQRVARKITAIKGGSGDYAVGLLDEPVPAGIRVYPLPTPTPDLKTRLIDVPVIVTDQHRRLYVHRIKRFQSYLVFFKYSNHIRKKILVSGDSGNPSFLMVRGQPVLVETHYGGGPGIGPFYGDARVQMELKFLISELDPNYSFKTVSY